MKKLIFLFLCTFITIAWGQNLSFDNLNANSLTSKSITWLSSNYGNGFGHRIINSDPGGLTLLNFQGRHNNTTWTDILTLTSNGNVGIGTNTPGTKLDVNGNIYVKSPGSSWLGGKTGTGGISSSTQQTNTAYHSLIRQKTASGHVINLGGLGDRFGFFGYDKNRTANGYDYTMIMDLNNGNVGIGTFNPDSKLTVAGNIHSREVKVTVNAGADFVFEDNYNLPTLEEVQQFIQENGHLPEIASAKEMEEKGIHLSEMNIKLLQKIEELTLYAIEQEKQLKELKNQVSENKNLKEEINNLTIIVEKLIKNQK